MSSAPDLLESLFWDEEIAGVFSDSRFIAAMLQVEGTLARVEARLRVIPAEAGEDIGAKAISFQPSSDLLRERLKTDGVPVIELVRQLREHVGEPHANYVHFGATSQDVMDTALVLQVAAAVPILEGILHSLVRRLALQADRHRNTLMPGRTHLQQAVPITFGFKVAGWLTPLLRHRQRLAELKPRLLVVQFGGAAGTLEPLGEIGTAVQDALATELKLSVPLMPWHTQRDTLVELAGWLSMVGGAVAKMAQDIILLAQSEVAEVRESSEKAHGGSSTMPQKSNPIYSEQIIACARSNAAILSSMHQALILEHERGTHGWQMEWLALPRMFGLTAAALRKADYLAEHLAVDEARMQHNVGASNGLMLAEAISYTLSKLMGRSEAKRLVGEACQAALAHDRHLIDVLREKIDAPVDWEALQEEAAHLGSSQAFIDRVIRAAGE
jgi:3-carboxy-cis,cis-muconate cycloisomerase